MSSECTSAVRVHRKIVEALGVCSFELIPEGGANLSAFSAGSHIDVLLPNGLTRQYSLCNSPSDKNRYMIGVLDVPASRGGSRFMVESLNENDVIKISAPRNQFPLVEGADHHVLIAGGIGITPIRSMALQLSSKGESFELHYAARSAKRMAFADDIRSGSFATQASFHLSDGDPGQRLDLPALLNKPAGGTHVYVCGPQGLIEAVFGAARNAGWTDAQLHREFFSVAINAKPIEQAFQVKLASTGKLIDVPKGTTVVEALADVGVEILTSCEQGICGTCVTRVLEGVPDHRDVFLSSEQHASNNLFTPCCSRSNTSLLVLDL